jgi:cadmium resistance protein CadD (predicted permease)
MSELNAAWLAVLLFAVTDVDDLFVLVAFLADTRFTTRQVILGQYLGIALLVGASLTFSLISLVLDPAVVGLLGVIPVALGCKKAIELWRGEDAEAAPSAPRFGNVLWVATVTMANGGDNIGVYTPIFATSTPSTKGIVIAVFALMTAVWISVAFWLFNHRTLGAPIRRFGNIITPAVMMGIGAYVLYQAHSFSLLARLLG